MPLLPPLHIDSTPLFCLSGQEIARLEFVAWLVETGRLSEWQQAAIPLAQKPHL